jgi:TIR domain
MNQTANFDVFLSHNGKEQRAAIAIGDRLRNWGLRVWLDAWELRPGLSWQEGILEGLASSAACAVLIGQSGYGGWHKREMEAALLRQGSEYPVIPVLLPGAPNRTDVGAFLSLLTWVDFRLGIDDTEALDRLIWGITGLRPNEAKGAVESEVRSLHSAVKAEGPSAPRYPSRGSRHPFKTGTGTGIALGSSAGSAPAIDAQKQRQTAGFRSPIHKTATS